MIQWTVGAVLIAYALYSLLLKPAAPVYGARMGISLRLRSGMPGRRHQRLRSTRHHLHVTTALEQGSDQGYPSGIFRHLRHCGSHLPGHRRARYGHGSCGISLQLFLSCCLEPGLDHFSMDESGKKHTGASCLSLWGFWGY